MIKNIKLTPRLKTALSFTEGAVLADIGTDHAYLPIAACLTGRAERAVACDIKPGPLTKAAENIRRYGLTGRIETRLGGGLKPLAAGEADSTVIAGMGGMAIAEILSESPETARRLKKIILQPQHDAERLRRFLHDASYLIENEALICEGSKYYFVMSAIPSETSVQEWNESEYFYGRHVLKKGGAVLDAFLKKEAEMLAGYMRDGETEALIKRKRLNDGAMKLV